MTNMPLVFPGEWDNRRLVWYTGNTRILLAGVLLILVGAAGTEEASGLQ